MSYKYEVYIARYNNHVLYVGQGMIGRHKHCNSGKSHVFNLNKVFFNFGEMDIEVIPQPSQESAIHQEALLISKLKPIFNKVGADYNKMTDRSATFANFLDELLLESGESNDKLNGLLCDNRELRLALENKEIALSELRQQMDKLQSEIDKVRAISDTTVDLYNEQLVSSVKLTDEPLSKKVVFLKLRESGFTQKDCVNILSKSLATIKRWEKKYRGAETNG